MSLRDKEDGAKVIAEADEGEVGGGMDPNKATML